MSWLEFFIIIIDPWTGDQKILIHLSQLSWKESAGRIDALILRFVNILGVQMPCYLLLGRHWREYIKIFFLLRKLASSIQLIAHEATPKMYSKAKVAILFLILIADIHYCSTWRRRRWRRCPTVIRSVEYVMPTFKWIICTFVVFSLSFSLSDDNCERK